MRVLSHPAAIWVTRAAGFLAFLFATITGGFRLVPWLSFPVIFFPYWFQRPLPRATGKLQIAVVVSGAVACLIMIGSLILSSLDLSLPALAWAAFALSWLAHSPSPSREEVIKA
jgi:hypothetical protein